MAAATSAAAGLRSLNTSVRSASAWASSSRAMIAAMVSRSLRLPATMIVLVRGSGVIRRSIRVAPAAGSPVRVSSGRTACWAAPPSAPPNPPAPNPPAAAQPADPGLGAAGEELREQVGGEGRVGPAER